MTLFSVVFALLETHSSVGSGGEKHHPLDPTALFLFFKFSVACDDGSRTNFQNTVFNKYETVDKSSTIYVYLIPILLLLSAYFLVIHSTVQFGAIVVLLRCSS